MGQGLDFVSPCPEDELLLSKEDREEHDTFDKRCKNDRDRKDGTGCAWVATGGFSCFRAEETDTDSCSESGCGYGEVPGVEVAGCLCEDFEWHIVIYGLCV